MTAMFVLGECNREIFECAHRVRCYPEYQERYNFAKREFSCSVCENFSHRFIRFSSFVRFLRFGSLLVSDVAEENIFHFLSLFLSFSLSLSLCLSHTLFLAARIANPSEAGCTDAYMCNRL